MLEVLKFLPKKIVEEINKYDFNNLEEIRIRVDKPVILKFCNREIVTDYIIKQDEILTILQFLCDNSIYSYQSQICSGYITIAWGHRVGITGDVVFEEGKVKNISYIYSLNFRIARQVDGAAKEILPYVIDLEKQSVFNTLIVGSPGTGKTTAIRDLAKIISNGNELLKFNRNDSWSCR